MPHNVMVTIFSIFLVTETCFILKDIDECDRFHPCDQICANTEGSFICTCRDGFLIDDTETNCQGNV